MGMEQRLIAAENILYGWACDTIETRNCKAELLKLGFDVDFRQPDRGNWVEAADLQNDGAYVEIFC